MITLAIDTAYPALSLALFDGDALLAERHEPAERGQAELIVPAIAALLRSAGVARAGTLLVDIGPGSYTGIRIGLAAALALGLAWDAPVHGLSATALAAAAAFAREPELAAVGIVLPAGRGRHYVEAFDRALDPLTPLAACDAAAVDAALPAGLVRADPTPRAAAARWLPASARMRSPVPLYLGSTSGPAAA